MAVVAGARVLCDVDLAAVVGGCVVVGMFVDDLAALEDVVVVTGNVLSTPANFRATITLKVTSKYAFPDRPRGFKIILPLESFLKEV